MLQEKTIFQLIHSSVIDTSVAFPHRLGLPYKRALRTLMAENLGIIIQNSGSQYSLRCHSVLLLLAHYMCILCV